MAQSPPASWIACPFCDRLHTRTPLAPGQVAHCRRCHTPLFQCCRFGIQFPLALSLAAGIGYIVGIFLPFVTLTFQGQSQTISLISAIRVLVENGMPVLAGFVSLLLLLAPLTRIAGQIYLSGCLYFGIHPPFHRPVLLFITRVSPWNMTEVYLASIFVVLVKATKMADVILEPAFWAFTVQVTCLVLSGLSLRIKEFWELLDPAAPHPAPPREETAKASDLSGCHVCGMLHPISHHGKCRRCQSAIHPRKPNSIHKTMALTITALILYIPANVYPIMIINNFGQNLSSTILSGVVELWDAESYIIALIVFFASVFVPIAKLAILTFLCWSARFGTCAHAKDRTRLYTLTEAIGRWSMIDVFVVATLAALIQMGNAATIEPGIASTAFAAMVVVTIFAAEAFDPRLLWEPQTGICTDDDIS